jgi:hypothetical protein
MVRIRVGKKLWVFVLGRSGKPGFEMRRNAPPVLDALPGNVR